MFQIKLKYCSGSFRLIDKYRGNDGIGSFLQSGKIYSASVLHLNHILGTR